MTEPNGLVPEHRPTPPFEGRIVRVEHYAGAPESTRHFHREYELIYVTGALGEREVASVRSPVAGKVLLLVGPDLSHSWTCSATEEASCYVVLRFSEDSLGKDMLRRPAFGAVRALLEHARHGVVFPADVPGALTDRIQRMPALSEARRAIAVWDILTELAEAPRTYCADEPDLSAFHSPQERDAFNLVREIILAQPNKRVSLSEAARAAGMSVSSFSRFIRRVTGTSFVDYVNRAKLSRAADLLRASDGTVLEISLEVGFNSVSHFNRLFMRLHGCSPARYRRSCSRSNAGQARGREAES